MKPYKLKYPTEMEAVKAVLALGWKYCGKAMFGQAFKHKDWSAVLVIYGDGSIQYCD